MRCCRRRTLGGCSAGGEVSTVRNCGVRSEGRGGGAQAIRRHGGRVARALCGPRAGQPASVQLFKYSMGRQTSQAGRPDFTNTCSPATPRSLAERAPALMTSAAAWWSAAACPPRPPAGSGTERTLPVSRGSCPQAGCAKGGTCRSACTPLAATCTSCPTRPPKLSTDDPLPCRCLAWKKYSAARSSAGISVKMSRRSRSVTQSISSRTRPKGPLRSSPCGAAAAAGCCCCCAAAASLAAGLGAASACAAPLLPDTNGRRHAGPAAQAPAHGTAAATAAAAAASSGLEKRHRQGQQTIVAWGRRAAAGGSGGRGQAGKAGRVGALQP